MSWTDSNMQQQWNWEVFLTERSDGSLSTGARQYGEGIQTGRMRGTYRIRTGAALKKAIDSLLASDAFVHVAWNWPSLLRKISRFSPLLAEGVRQQRQLEQDEQYKRTAEMRRIATLIRPVQDWVNRASWPPSNSSGGGGLGYAVGSARLTAGVFAYAKAYRADHGHFPTGVHEIDQAIGSAEAAAQCEARQDGIGRAVNAPGRVQLTVQFPEAQSSIPKVF
jgi:hypothetical protein